MSEENFIPDKQDTPAQARMTRTMQNVRRWFLVTLCCWGTVTVLTLIAAIVAVAGMGWPVYDAAAAENFIGITMKIVNVLLFAMYASAAVAVAYFLRYMYLDGLFKKYTRIVE